jgi:hypothetical protein
MLNLTDLNILPNVFLEDQLVEFATNPPGHIEESSFYRVVSALLRTGLIKLIACNIPLKKFSTSQRFQTLNCELGDFQMKRSGLKSF